MQLRCLAAALSSCCSASSSSSSSTPGTVTATSSSTSSVSGDSSSGGLAKSIQLLLTLCTNADCAADAVDAVHEGLGYCLLASLSEPQGEGWPSTGNPTAAVAAATTAAAEQEATCAVDAAAADCVAQLMQPSVTAEQQRGQELDWPVITQALNLLHGGLPAVPLPNFWAVGSLNRASGSLAAAGACLAASAAAAAGSKEASTKEPDSSQAAGAGIDTSTAHHHHHQRQLIAAAVADWLHSMTLLELQVPLLLRPVQLQHAHLLQAATVLAGSHGQSQGDPSTAPSASAVTAAGAKAEPRGAAAVLQDVSAALGVAIHYVKGAAGAAGVATALAAAAVSRLQDAVESAGSYHAPAIQDSSVAAPLVLGLVQQQRALSAQAEGQQEEQELHEGSVLQQLWQCVALDLLDTSKLVEFLQQVTGALHGSEDAHVQELHDSFLQQLRQSLLQLPQQHFEQLLLRQLSTHDAFASNSDGLCRDLWQQLLLGAEADSTSSAVLLLQRLLEAVLHLAFSTQQAGPGSSSGSDNSTGLRKTHLAAVGPLLGVVIHCATALGLPGVLACLGSLKALAAACTEWVSGSSRSSSASDQAGRTDAGSESVTARLIPFLPLLLFAQRVVSQSSASPGSSRSPSSRSRPVRKSGSASSRSSRESGLRGSQISDGDQQSNGNSSSADDVPDPTQQASAQADPSPAGSSSSQTSIASAGPFEAAAAADAGLALQDDAVQVLGGIAPAAPFDDGDDFYDEFEDEEEYLTQLLHNGALAAAASTANGAPAAAAAAPAVSGGAGDADGEGDDSTSDEDASSSDDDDNYHDSEDGLPARNSSVAEPSAAVSASAAAAPRASSASAAAADAASAAAAAAAAAFGAALQAHPLGEAVDEDEQALLDEEFGALLQELLSAGASPDVALAAVTAATGMPPPAAAVAAATEAAAASGDDEMVAVVEQLAAGAAAAAAAAASGGGAEGSQHAGTAATSVAASPARPSAAGRQQEGNARVSGGSSSSSKRRLRQGRSSSDSSSSSSSYLPQLRQYWLRTRHEQAATGSSSSSSAETLQCTFAVHGDQFVEQHWFQCYTCGLTDSRGCCSACARTCHAGHDVVYAAKSRFFCDCGGENGPRGNAVACKCLSAVTVKAPAAAAAAPSSTDSSSSLVQQGWLLPAAADPLARADLASSLPDPLDAAWTFDPRLYPENYDAAATDTSSSSSSRGAGEQGSDQGVSADRARHLLQGGGSGKASEQQAAALKLVPQGLVAKAARTLRPWLQTASPGTAAAAAADGLDAGESPLKQQQQQQGPREVLQGVASSTLQLTRLLLGLLLQPGTCHTARSSSSSAAAAAAAGGMQGLPVLPAVLHTGDLILEGSGSSRSNTKVLNKPATGSDRTDSGSSDCGGAQQQQQQQPLLELQRVIRLGTMSSSTSSSRTRTRSSNDHGSDSSSSRGPELPAEVAAALEGGVVCQQSAAAARQGQLLAVCRGEAVGLMDGRLLAAELCGKELFTKVGVGWGVNTVCKCVLGGG
jgi:hypothetical protein